METFMIILGYFLAGFLITVLIVLVGGAIIAAIGMVVELLKESPKRTIMNIAWVVLGIIWMILLGATLTKYGIIVPPGV